MKLLLDIGNSRIKWAWLDARGDLHGGVPCLHAEESVPGLLERIDGTADAPDAVYISHVGSEALRKTLDTSIKTRWGEVEVHWLQAQAEACGVRCAYVEPGRLGADRWAALIGARARWPGAVAILDFGTAITLDGLAGDGTHVGGLIAPGYYLMLQALQGNTGQLAAAGAVGYQKSPALFAADTAGAIHAGIYHCIRGLVTEIRQQLEAREPGGYTLVATGGGLEHVRAFLPADTVIMPDLVLHGLARVAVEVV